jgi:transposase
MKRVIMSGIDMHDNSLVCKTGSDKEEPTTNRFGNSLSGRKRYFMHLRRMSRAQGNAHIVVAYEASTQGFCLYDDCQDEGIECYILAPTKMRKSKKERKNKNDEADALLIFETLRGHVLAGNKLPSIWIPDDQTRADRETIRSRLDLGLKLTTVKTQVQTLQKAHRLRKPTDVGKAWTKPYRQWLVELSKQWPALATLTRQIASLENEITLLDAEVRKLSESKRYAEPCKALVESIKGVGVLTAMVYLAEMGDLSRFKNRQRVGSFLGLVPSSSESGETDDRKGHITREGSCRVRRVLCQATWSHVRCGGEEAPSYERIVKRNPKHKKIAVVAVMRQLGVRMWHVGLEAQRRANVFNNEVIQAEEQKVA